MKFTPSKYQQAIYDFIDNGEGNAVVEAVAGSGKSTTIVEALNLIPADKSVLFLAFNKAIVEELKIKVGNKQNVEIRTLHSLGAASVMRSFSCSIQADKYRSFINQGFKFSHFSPNRELDAEEFSEYKANILKLTDLIRVNLCTTYEEAQDLAYKHNLFIQDNELEIVNKVIKYGKNDTTKIDFTDMIYFPNIKNIRMQEYDWVFIDECQDLNTAQRKMFLKCVKPKTGRFIAVGDPKQAIYGFAGADVKSFNLLKTLPKTTTLPLSVCYRCNSHIIKQAQSIVPQIEARDNAPTGEVNQAASIKDVQDGDMILCRVTAPLTSLCMKYIANGTKAYIKGRDIGANLVNMLKRTNRTNIQEAMRIFDRELNKIAQKVAKSQSCSIAEAKHNNQYAYYEDKVAALNVLSEGLTQVRQLIKRIESIFSEGNRAGICLSTIHKSKGLEADRVFIACPDKLYNSRAMQVEWMAEQEDNLVYVAYTRAKHYLGFITDFEA